jgi:hypothetical protein
MFAKEEKECCMKSFIVMQTDFGNGVSVCTMEGVILNIDPELRIFNGNHNIKQFNTYEASFSLFYSVPFWVDGTVFVSVVDPGVGTSRRPCVAKLKNGSYVITPDNGSLTHMVKHIGVDEVRIIDEKRHRLASTLKVSIFHGRDLFACVAGKLASGLICFEEVGEKYPVSEIILHRQLPVAVESGTVSGMLETADRRFGLICTNIPVEIFEQQNIVHGDRLETVITNMNGEIYRDVITYAPSFGHVAEGEALVMVGETQQIQIAKNLHNMSVEYDLGTGPDWAISFHKVLT